MVPENNKILIVDDDDSMREILGKKFSDNGFVVNFAKDGEEGLELFQLKHPDLIILDNIMPKMDGVTMMQKVRELGGEGESVPIIIFTNFDTNDHVMEFVSKYNPAFYLVKSSVSLDEVLEKSQLAIKRQS